MNWGRFYARERRRRVPLPTYPFEKQRYWIGPVEDGAGAAPAEPRDVSGWFYTPRWRERASTPDEQARTPKRWLVFADGGALGSEVMDALIRGGDEVLDGGARERVRRDERANAIRFVPRRVATTPVCSPTCVHARDAPENIVHVWTTSFGDGSRPPRQDFETHQSHGLYSLIFLAQALQKTQRHRRRTDRGRVY